MGLNIVTAPGQMQVESSQGKGSTFRRLLHQQNPNLQIVHYRAKKRGSSDDIVG